MLIQREKYSKLILQGFQNNPIVILTGARQVGKTSLMKMTNLNKKTLFMHGQRPDSIELFSDFELISKHLRLHMGEDTDGLLLLDEFKFIPGISLTLKLLADHYPNLKILCSGSSSIEMKQKTEESLAGRVRVIPVYSLSFPEYLLFADKILFEMYQKYTVDDDFRLYDPKIKQHLSDYLLYGGLPKVALTDDFTEKKLLLQDIYHTYLLKDVKSFVRNEDTVGFNKLLRLLSAQTACEININELSITSGLSYNKTEDYLYLLEQMFIIQRIEPLLSNKRKEINKMRKVFFNDTGIRNIIYNSFNEMEFRTDKGAIFENFVFLQLMTSKPMFSNIQFYRTRDRLEIDFVITSKSKVLPVEAKCQSFTKPHNYRSLMEFNKIFDYHEGLLVNMNYNGKKEKLRYISGVILPRYFELSDF